MTRAQPPRACKIIGRAKCKTKAQLESDSTIGQHLLNSEECAFHYNDSQCAVIAVARTQFHLNLLEAVYIRKKQPNLCRQKEFVFSLQLFH